MATVKQTDSAIQLLDDDGKVVVEYSNNGNLFVRNPSTENKVFEINTDVVTSGTEEEPVQVKRTNMYVFNPIGNQVFSIETENESHTIKQLSNGGDVVSCFNSDGSGSLAKGNITWDAAGNLNATSVS